MEDMIKMIADAPDEQRLQMVTERVKMIAGQPDDQRVQSVKGMVVAISKLDDKKKGPFHNTRMKAIMSLSPKERSAMMHARARAVHELPEDIDKEDTKYVMEFVKHIPEEKQKAFMTALKQAFDSAGVPVPAMA
ncbi:MAG: hypothetical protein ACW991_09495 [Candidatus Hodarchaeales archaeon]